MGLHPGLDMDYPHLLQTVHSVWEVDRSHCPQGPDKALYSLELGLHPIQVLDKPLLASDIGRLESQDKR
jgi:hypothetical protein